MFPKPTKIIETTSDKILRYRNNRLQRLSLKRKDKKGKIPRIKQIPLKILKKKADTLFSLYIRKRDGMVCVTADSSCKGCMQASHLLKRSYYDIRWDEKNVFCSCSSHNYNHDQGFRPSPQILTNYFLKRFGQEEYHKLVERSKIEYTGRMIREKALEVIEKYKLEQ